MQHAERIRTGNGLIDGTVPRTLRECGIEDRTPGEYRAYHHMLFHFFIFGDDSRVKCKERRVAEQGGSRHA
ncbi:hypothetical protein A3A41_00405 [Candidatus Kaiserbacteria bacterium RIFCSPLOWO2_01_FULL_54_22]|nr:MAG: hypothetical protein A3A41_00405 [Candidatus Kaiserbacteria bacterium RIFCSPLOWO2_01_FULL_54_22]